LVHRQRIQPLALDLVLTPLVGFDHKGNRLGMGGGYYDRSFAFLLRRQNWKKPRLVGLAYDFQQLDKLPAKNWDVPLTAVATDTHWHSF
jgi:5-formyltetrahydrofolate cyclo-ligase